MKMKIKMKIKMPTTGRKVKIKMQKLDAFPRALARGIRESQPPTQGLQPRCLRPCWYYPRTPALLNQQGQPPTYNENENQNEN
jgi:hypothetical protein